MKLLSNILIVLISIAFGALSCRAQESVRLSGEVEYCAPLTMTPAEARERAIENARIELLRKEFGVAVGSHNIFVDREDSQRSESVALILSETDTNGEWIKDLKDPEIVSETRNKYGTLYLVRVEGLARRIEHQPIDLDIRLLCNGFDKNRDQLRGNTYYEGDNFYLYFSSPVAGWLTVYLCDDDPEMTMQAILPYDGQHESAYKIEPDKEYIFFSKQHAEPKYTEAAGGLKMYARKDVDVNIVYVVFSPNEFSRSATVQNRSAEKNVRVGEKSVNLMPRETTFSRFNSWLGKNRTKDPQMQVKKFMISIKKP